MSSQTTTQIAIPSAFLALSLLLGCSEADDSTADDVGTSGPPILNLNTSSSGSDTSAVSGSGGSSGTSDTTATSSGDFSGSSEAEVIGVNGEPGACESLAIETSCAGELYEGEVIP